MSDFVPVGTLLGNLRMTQILDWYDGPRTFVVENASGARFVAFWADDEGNDSLWLYAPISDRHVVEASMGRIDLRDLFCRPDDGFVYLVRLFPDNQASLSYGRPVEFDDEYFPIPGDRLRPDRELAPWIPQGNGVVGAALDSNVHIISISRPRSRLPVEFEDLSRTASRWSGVVRVLLKSGPVPEELEVGSLVATLKTGEGTDAAGLCDRLRALLENPSALNIGVLTEEERVVLLDFLDSMQSENLDVSISMPNRQEAPLLVMTPSRVKELRDNLFVNVRVMLNSMDIPQADNLTKVLMLSDALRRGAVNLEYELSVSARQVNYYKHAARILGIIDDNNVLTNQGYYLAGLGHDDRVEYARVLFETSRVGSSWMMFLEVTSALDIDVDTAVPFLQQVCRADTLSAETMHRRSRTLVSWVEEFQAQAPEQE